MSAGNLLGEKYDTDANETGTLITFCFRPMFTGNSGIRLWRVPGPLINSLEFQ